MRTTGLGTWGAQRAQRPKSSLRWLVTSRAGGTRQKTGTRRAAGPSTSPRTPRLRPHAAACGACCSVSGSRRPGAGLWWCPGYRDRDDKTGTTAAVVVPNYVFAKHLCVGGGGGCEALVSCFSCFGQDGAPVPACPFLPPLAMPGQRGGHLCTCRADAHACMPPSSRCGVSMALHQATLAAPAAGWASAFSTSVVLACVILPLYPPLSPFARTLLPCPLSWSALSWPPLP